ncbi:MAG: BamA/TamA family outer membrane protein [Dysgonamonadaceae bacterium]|jgi:outer membrane protein assembly factor BamA|nr:BamA/TamA family outer membrane protein [Dysgonamonadaceae bacterium]
MKSKNPLFLLLFVLAAACSPVKYIPEGQYLLSKTDIEMDDKGVDKALLLPFIQQKANDSKFGPAIYNLVKDDSNFIKRFIRRIGDPPVVFNRNTVDLSVNELAMELKNKGYLQAQVRAQVDTAKKRAEVIYHIHNGEPHRIRHFKIDIPLEETENSRRIGNHRLTNAVFDMSVLEKERKRISSFLRNQGYYTLTENNLHYLADTTACPGQVDLTLILSDTALFVPYTVQRVNVYSGYDPLEKENYVVKDSLQYKDLFIYYDKQHFLHPGILSEKVMVDPGKLFRERQGERTVSLFQALNCLGRVDLQYAEDQYPDSTLLDCNIYLTPGNNHSLQTALEGTNKAGNLGIAVDVTYGNLNLFNRSEIFNLRLRGAYEFVNNRSDEALSHNYYELGIGPSMTFPKLHLPFVRSFVSYRYNTKTQYSLSYNIQRRPEYMRNFFNLNWKLLWAEYRSPISHSLSLLDVNYVMMPWKSAAFNDYLNHNVDSLTRLSYENVFTAGIDYTLIYTNTGSGRIRQNLYTIRFNVETSGNALNGLFSAFHAPKSETGQYNILGNPFAQHVKGGIDYSETFHLSATGGLAFHLGVGVAYPYGNSSILPFEKRYYAGGPNNVRGWSTRYLGPGSYHQGAEKDPTVHVGDIQLILSAEYRFNILPWLEPAFFVDAGNIWTIKDYPNQPEGLFRWNKFYKEIAVGAGLGLRFDLNFLILRLDAGTRLYDPARLEGHRFVLFKEKFLRNSAAYIAIGYPF